jgi:acetolactate synthase I/II/III large subunit
VRQATRDVYPDGHAAKANTMPLVDLNPAPDFEMVAESCGAIGEKVATPEQLMPALRRAFELVRSGTPALLNVTTQGEAEESRRCFFSLPVFGEGRGGVSSAARPTG